MNIKALNMNDWRPFANELVTEINSKTNFGHVTIKRIAPLTIAIEGGAFPASFKLNTGEFTVWSRGSRYSGREMTPHELLAVDTLCIEWIQRNASKLEELSNND